MCTLADKATPKRRRHCVDSILPFSLPPAEKSVFPCSHRAFAMSSISKPICSLCSFSFFLFTVFSCPEYSQLSPAKPSPAEHSPVQHRSVQSSPMAIVILTTDDQTCFSCAVYTNNKKKGKKIIQDIHTHTHTHIYICCSIRNATSPDIRTQHHKIHSRLTHNP